MTVQAKKYLLRAVVLWNYHHESSKHKKPEVISISIGDHEVMENFLQQQSNQKLDMMFLTEIESRNR